MIKKYERKLKQFHIDQKTDDACSYEAYHAKVFILEQIIEDLKAIDKQMN